MKGTNTWGKTDLATVLELRECFRDPVKKYRTKSIREVGSERTSDRDRNEEKS